MLLLPGALGPMSEFPYGISFVTHGAATIENPEANKGGSLLFGTCGTAPVDFSNDSRYSALPRITSAVYQGKKGLKRSCGTVFTELQWFIF